MEKRLLAEPPLRTVIREKQIDVSVSGSWIATGAAEIEPLIQKALSQARELPIALDMSGIREMDTFGACLLDRLMRGAQRTEIISHPQRGQQLLDAIERIDPPAEAVGAPGSRLAWIEAIGRAVIGAFTYVLTFLGTLGAVAVSALKAVVRPRLFRLTPFVHQLDRVGVQAVPIVLLITFLIGCIIAQQSFFSFKKFGADTYIVDLLAFLVLRELGVLIVAIMVAGRSGSSYAAEIGSMKMRQEIDALRTMGVNFVEVLLLPRILALVVALPLLAFIGFIAALYGGGLVAWVYGGMSPAIFLDRLREAISITQIEVGMIKAPFMALAIGVIACAEGLAVKGSAESLGLKTTSSVVKSIFAIILLDGLLDLFFAAVGM